MLGGANSLTHWYCPPALGDIEAISAREATTGIVRIHVARKSQMVPCISVSVILADRVGGRALTARPPLMMENVLVLSWFQCCCSVANVGATRNSRQDSHPSAHNNTSQAQDRDRAEVSLSKVSIRHGHCVHVAHTFSSCALPKRSISFASSLVPLNPSSEASLSATCVSRALSCLDMMSIRGEGQRGSEQEGRKKE